MGIYIKGQDGKVYNVTEEAVVSRESLVEEVTLAQDKLVLATKELARFDALSQPVSMPEQAEVTAEVPAQPEPVVPTPEPTVEPTIAIVEPQEATVEDVPQNINIQ